MATLLSKGSDTGGAGPSSGGAGVALATGPERVCVVCRKKRTAGYECAVCEGFVCALCPSTAEAEFEACPDHLERLALRAFERSQAHRRLESIQAAKALRSIERILELSEPPARPVSRERSQKPRPGMIDEPRQALLRLGEVYDQAALACVALQAPAGAHKKIPEPARAFLLPYLRGYAAAMRYGEVTLLWLVVLLAVWGVVATIWGAWS